MTRELLSEIESLQADIKKVRTVNINSKDVKENVIRLGTDYFKLIRPRIPKINSTIVDSVDSLMQDLIRLGHGNNSKKSYEKSLKELIYKIKEINIQVASTPQSNPSLLQPDELKIIDTLSKIVPSASLSYQQAVIDINQTSNRLSYRGTANELRESLRETLDYLAPDNDIIKSPDFKLETGQNKPTMKQKVRFILKSRGYGDSKRGTAEKTTQLIEELFGQVTRAIYDRASISAHKKSERDEIQKIKRFVDAVLLELLEL